MKTGALASFGSQPDVAVFKRVSEGEELLVMVNVRDTVREYSLPSPLANTAWTDGMTGEMIALGDEFDIAAV